MSHRNEVVYTAYGIYYRRYSGEDAPLICEGTCGRVTMHSYGKRQLFPAGHCVFKDDLDHTAKPYVLACFHTMYQCKTCGHLRIWG